MSLPPRRLTSMCASTSTTVQRHRRAMISSASCHCTSRPSSTCMLASAYTQGKTFPSAASHPRNVVSMRHHIRWVFVTKIALANSFLRCNAVRTPTVMALSPRWRVVRKDSVLCLIVMLGYVAVSMARASILTATACHAPKTVTIMIERLACRSSA